MCICDVAIDMALLLVVMLVDQPHCCDCAICVFQSTSTCSTNVLLPFWMVFDCICSRCSPEMGTFSLHHFKMKLYQTCF